MAQQTLNRDAFRKRISVLAVPVPAEKSSFFIKSPELKGCICPVFGHRHDWLITSDCSSILNLPKMKSVVPDPSDPQGRLVLFRVPEFGRFSCRLGIGYELTNYLKQADLNEPTQEFLKFHKVTNTTHDIDLDYNFWNAGETATRPENPCR